MSRVMGASWQADAFFVAFRLPNTFRRLFGEGAFSAGFVPLYSQRLQGENGEAEAKRFSEEVLGVFLPTLILFTVLFLIIMRVFVAAISGYDGVKLDLATFLTRITFPYLLLISLVSLFSGILNSLARFTAAAFAPALLNLAMLGALIFVPVGGRTTAVALAGAVTFGGVLQLILLLAACKRAGVVLKLKKPRMTPGVRQFVRVVVPATLGAGVYQISAFIDTFFLTRIGTGAMSYFNYADRLNQLPLGVIGAALGTAILPQVSKHVGAGEPDKAAHIQGQAAELAMLLCLPAALALAVSALPLISALFQGGRFTPEDARQTALTLSIVSLGLPAYVLVKVLTPGFYSRQDTSTPVKIAALVLVATIVLNFLLIPTYGIAGLASAIAICSWLNCVMLYVVLHRRGHFRNREMAGQPSLPPIDRMRRHGGRALRYSDACAELVQRLGRPQDCRGHGARRRRYGGLFSARLAARRNGQGGTEKPLPPQEVVHRCRLTPRRCASFPESSRPAGCTWAICSGLFCAG